MKYYIHNLLCISLLCAYFNDIHRRWCFCLVAPLETRAKHRLSNGEVMSKETAGRGLSEEERKQATAVGTQTPIDTSTLADFLPAMAPKWFEIGLKLGCKDMAKSLESREPRSRKCFMVIDEWMKKEGENGNACWEYLCGVVLRSEGVGLGDVADRIERVIKMHSVESDWDHRLG